MHIHINGWKDLTAGTVATCLVMSLVWHSGEKLVSFVSGSHSQSQHADASIGYGYTGKVDGGYVDTAGNNGGYLDTRGKNGLAPTAPSKTSSVEYGGVYASPDTAKDAIDYHGGADVSRDRIIYDSYTPDKAGRS